MIWRGRTGQESSRGETLIPSQPDSRGPASGARRAPGRLIAGTCCGIPTYSTPTFRTNLGADCVVGRHMAETVECDFVRFMGRKSLDDDGDAKHHLISGGEGDLQLPPEASLLVASNRYGALIAGTTQGLRWAWLADLSQECAPRGVQAAFTSVDLGGTPIALALSTDDAQLACVTTTSGGAATHLQLFDVAGLLRGRCASRHPRAVDRHAACSARRPHPQRQARTQGRPQAQGHRFATRIAGARPQPIQRTASPPPPPPLLFHRRVCAPAADVSACLAVLQWSPMSPARLLMLDTAGLRLIECAPFAELALAAAGKPCSACWSSDGRAIFCGSPSGQLTKLSATGELQPMTPLTLPSDVLPTAELSCVCPLSSRFLLLVHDRSDDDPRIFPFFSVLDLEAGELHECGACCIPGMRTDPAGQTPRRRFFCRVLPDWRMAVVCSSDSDEVCCIGSRNAKSPRWQKWTLPDEEGPPSIPMFEHGDECGDQFVMGLALDLVNQEQLALIAGEETFPPSPVLWCLTSHGSVVAWTVMHKKAPPTDQRKYGFMRVPEPLPAGAPPSAPPVAAAPTPSAIAPAAIAPPTAAAPALPPAAVAGSTSTPTSPPPSAPPVKSTSATPNQDLVGAAEMGDHEALCRALRDGVRHGMPRLAQHASSRSRGLREAPTSPHSPLSLASC